MGTTSPMHFLMKPVMEIVSSSMLSTESQNIFQSATEKLTISQQSELRVLPISASACTQEAIVMT
jgi:hypothetical protein